jgi:hypothetical protein
MRLRTRSRSSIGSPATSGGGVRGAFAEQDGSVAPDGIFDGRTALMASIHDRALQAARQYADQAMMVAEKLKPGTCDSVRN